MRESIRYALILSALVHIGLQAFSALETRKWGGRHAGAIGVTHPDGSPSLTGCYLAAVLPLAPWPLWPVFALGLWWAGSWLAYVALSAALLLGTPGTMGWVPIALCSVLAALVVASRGLGGGWRWAEWTPRGDSLDSITLRLRTWRVVSLALIDRRIWPHGRRPLAWDLHRYAVGTGASVDNDAAFCEPIQLVYEYGVWALWAIGLWAYLVWPHLHAGDRWTVALVTWALTACGSTTFRVWPFWILAGLLTTGVLWAS